MTHAITSGFPLRRCSWIYAPVVARPLTRSMIRWLDSVCTSRMDQKHARGGTHTALDAKGGINAT